MTPSLRILAFATALVGTVGVAAVQPPVPEPARFLAGPLPPLSPLVVGGGEVFLELEVSSAGRPAAANVLRATPPFTDDLITAVKQWQFEPATAVKPPAKPGGPPIVEPTDSGVLVVATFRAPSIMAATLGELPKDISAPSSAIPFPLVVRQPPWPPLAVAGGVVLVEARVDGRGAVADVRLVQGSPGFESAALDAVRGWAFRPVRTPDAPDHSLVYVVLGFPVPVTPPKKQ